MRRALALTLVFATALASDLLAQSTNASVTGRITDPSKAVIVDARVAAISAGTNSHYETTSNGSGEYYLANLTPGPYRLEIEKPGFKKLIKPDVILHVQDVLDIDIEMAVGSASESITVEAGAPLVNTESGTVSTVTDRTFDENLPLNGRSLQTLIMLTPGVVVTATAFDDQGQFSVNGQRADANYFTVDGVSANFGVTGYIPLVQSASGALPALSTSGGTNSLVSIDAMQEFRVQTSSFAPEFARTPGGQICIVTRSGTNAFHGTLFEYFRNSALDAADWFANYNQLPKAEELRMTLAVFGGPIVKDKTFFFFSYEGLRLRQPSTQETVVPDTPSRELAPASMQPYLNAYPIANGAELGAGLAQFNASFSDPSTLNAYSMRVDQIINWKLNLFGRYNYSPSSFDQRGWLPAPFTVLTTTESMSSSVQTVTVGLTQLIEPEISNEVRANYSNHRVGTKLALDHFGGAVPPPDSLLFPPRVGVTYQLSENPNWGTIFRAGFGVFYDLGQGSLGGVSSYFPYQAEKIILPAPFPLSPQSAAPPALTTNPPVPNILVAQPDLKLPRTYQFGFPRALTGWRGGRLADQLPGPGIVLRHERSRDGRRRISWRPGQPPLARRVQRRRCPWVCWERPLATASISWGGIGGYRIMPSSPVNTMAGPVVNCTASVCSAARWARRLQPTSRTGPRRCAKARS